MPASCRPGRSGRRGPPAAPPRRPGQLGAPPAGRAGRRAGILPATCDRDRRGRRRRRAGRVRPVRRRPPGPARDTIASDGHGDAHIADAQVVDHLDGDRRGDGDPRPVSRAASYGSAVTYALIREGRACRRQRHADAAGRFSPVARQASGESEHRCFVNDQPSAAPAAGMPPAGRAAAPPAGYGRARPAGGMPTAKSAVPGHGRRGWTPRASCPWASAHTPQRNTGGGVGLREDRELWWSLRSGTISINPYPPPPPFPCWERGSGGWASLSRQRRPGAARPPRPSAFARSGPPARWRAAGPALPSRRAARSAGPAPSRHHSLVSSLLHVCFPETTQSIFSGKIAIFPVFRLVRP